MNNFTVEFFNSNLKQWEKTNRAVFTAKFANLLDEQLDEATIALKGDSTPCYTPFTLVRITITNNPEAKVSKSKFDLISNQKETSVQYNSYNYADERITQKLTLFMFVANDKAIETPVGSGKYNHELYLIELTKITERYICDTLTFTNPLGSNYSENATNPYFTVNYHSGGATIDEGKNKITGYKTPSGKTDFKVIDPINFFKEYLPTIWAEQDCYFNPGSGVFITDSQGNKIYEQYLDNMYNYDENDIVNEYVIIERIHGQITRTKGLTSYTKENFPWFTNIEIDFNNEGFFNIIYKAGNVTNSFLGSIQYYQVDAQIAIVSNHLPLKKWTITDVIQRVFDLVEEVSYSQVSNNSVISTTPKFRLKNADATKYDQILAPEFSFTKSTLREILQQIGGFIHAEARVESFNATANLITIRFDEYGSNKYSKISEKPYITATFGTNINQYCTAIDSSADNLTNTLDWAQGVLIEPFNNGAKSLRTETITARLAEDDSTIIQTQFPISRIQKLECRYIPISGMGFGNWDLTPYVFESTAYLSELSSYNDVYPFSKKYALYYTLGQKNIKGLFFKGENAFGSVFEKYSIINILRAVTGENDLNIEGQDLMKLSFAVTYMPLYSTRIKTHKQLIQEGYSSTLAYNQGANAIESRYYGEHLKGVVERLGNIEKTYTYKLAFLSQIPVAGTRFDNNYYISNVSWELFPTYIKCTVGLSKHFNRLSQYIGINSQKRMWEISERQSVIRESVYPLYIVVSENEIENDSHLNSEDMPKRLAHLLFLKSYCGAPVSVAKVSTYDIYNKPITENILMPVIASALGNSMLFTYAFEDNYSAGQKIEYVDVNNGYADISGYWGNYVKYTNYYGRFYLLKTQYEIAGFGKNEKLSLSLPQLPANIIDYSSVFYTHKCVYRKDNREIPQITHQITVVTDNDKIIIGSALCRNSSVINANPKQCKVYYLNKEINLFDNKINLEEVIPDIDISHTVNENSIRIANPNNINCKAWAIATIPEETTINIEAENGTQTTQKIYEGGEILLAQNNPVFNGNEKTIYFALKRKINE